MSSTPRAPQRGDVIWIDLDPQAGSEQAGRRPAVVLSPHKYNSKVGLALLCPITSRTKGYPFEVALPEGLQVHGVILADHIKSLDWRVREAEFTDKLPERTMDEVLRKVGLLLTGDAHLVLRPRR